MTERGAWSKGGMRAVVVGVCLTIAALVGAVFAMADTGSPGCGYGGYGSSEYCQPAGNASIAGTVVQAGTGAPLQYANVVARDASGKPFGTTSDRDGSFVIGGLPAGDYIVGIARYGHMPQWYDGVDVGTPEFATQVSLAADETFSLQATMVPLAETISGTVTDAATGLPVPGICLQYTLVPSIGDPTAPPAQLGGACPGAFTGPTGQYVLAGLVSGFEYVVQASDPQARYVTEYYQDAADVLSASRLTVPTAADIAMTLDDGDGVTEPPGYDGNADGIPDEQQANVSTVEAASGQPVTIAAPDAGYPVTAVTATAVPPETPLPTGVTLPNGLIGFTVTLPDGASSVDVAVVLPAGTAPTGYYKLQNGSWSAFTAHTTIVGDVVTLHLVDGGAGDADGSVNGVVVDPGGASRAYGFGGFSSPTAGQVAKAGSTIPVKWRVTDASGAPVNDPASFVGLTATPCGGGTPVPVATPGSSGLKSTGDGGWHLNWKTPKAMAGSCQTLTLALADPYGGGSVDVTLK